MPNSPEQDKKLDALAGSIEIVSKFSKSLLFTSVITTSFVLVTVMGGGSKKGFELPFINLPIPEGQFYLITPVLIFLIYTYLHIYIGELLDRLKEYRELELELKSGSEEYSSYKLFPWLLVFSRKYLFEDKKTPSLFRITGFSGFQERKYYTYLASRFVIWYFIPFSLFYIWWDFLKHGRFWSMSAMICFILSWMVKNSYSKDNMKIFIDFLAQVTVMFTITMSSVPALREVPALAYIWEIVSVDDLSLFFLKSSLFVSPVILIYFIFLYLMKRYFPHNIAEAWGKKIVMITTVFTVYLFFIVAIFLIQLIEGWLSNYTP